jgi:hypothetical protein
MECSTYISDCIGCVKNNCIFAFFNAEQRLCVNSTLFVFGDPEGVFSSFCPDYVLAEENVKPEFHTSSSNVFEIGKISTSLTCKHIFACSLVLFILQAFSFLLCFAFFSVFSLDSCTSENTLDTFKDDHHLLFHAKQ